MPDQSLSELMKHLKFKNMFLGLVLLLFVRPLFPDAPSSFNWSYLLFLVVIVTGLVAASDTRRKLYLGLILGTPAFLIVLGNAIWWEYPAARVAAAISLLVFLVFTSWNIVTLAYRQEIVSWDMVLGAASVFLLLAVTWALAYALLYFQSPEHFHISKLHDIHGADPHEIWLYFSLVTITTLGYGDILPVTPMARILASSESVTGQLYIALTLARIVGLHISHKR